MISNSMIATSDLCGDGHRNRKLMIFVSVIRAPSMWLVSFETPPSCFVRSAQEFFGPTTAARHAPVLYLAPAHLSLRSCVSQVLISTFLTLLITGLNQLLDASLGVRSDFGLLVPTRPVTPRNPSGFSSDYEIIIRDRSHALAIEYIT
jgi:hypothetical protein